MRPGTRVLSYSFTMGDWEPDDHADSDGDGSAYLWVVPASAAGTWRFQSADGDGFEVALEQTFQMLRGHAGDAALTGKLSGASIELTFSQGDTPVRLAGIVDGDRMSVAVTRAGRTTSYIGTRN
jgi:hypothetical protein